MGTGKNGTRERDTRGGGSTCPRGRKKAMKVVSRPLSNYLVAAASDLSIILTENALTNKVCESVVHLYPRSICYLIIERCSKVCKLCRVAVWTHFRGQHWRKRREER